MKRAAAAWLLAAAACGAFAAAAEDTALDSLLGTLAAAESDAVPAQRWPARAALARHFAASRQPALAAFFGKQAVAAIEAARSEPAPAERGSVAERLAVYRELADLLVATGRVDEALLTLRQMKEEEFFDFVQRESGWVDAEARAGLDSSEQRLAERWSAVPPPARARAVSGGEGGSAAWLADARAALQDMAAMAAPAIGRATPRAPQPPPAGGETLHVHAIAGESHLTLVFETPTWVQAQQIAWGRASAAQEIGALLGALGRGEAALPQLQALHRRLGAPIAEAARSRGARRVVMHGDGVLRYLPMAALHDGQAFLGAQFTFVQQARALAATPRGAVGRMPLLQAVGVSLPLPGQRALPGVAHEVCAIVAGPVRGLGTVDAACGPGGDGRGVVPGEGWLNEQFTARRLADATVRGAAAGGAMLHVGTHFDLRPGQMARSSMLLGDGTRLPLDAIARLDFRGHELVTLSACETGVGGAAGADGAEVEGLNLLLIRRGARAVLASLWRVDDQSTSALMAAFYRELAHSDAAEALRRAQAGVRATAAWQSPFHWAGFYVTLRP